MADSRKVHQYTLDGKFIKEFESGRQAGEKTYADRNNILAVCKGRRKTAGGYRWQYGE